MTTTDSKPAESSDPRRELVSVSALLERADVQRLVTAHSRSHVVAIIRSVLDDARETLTTGGAAPAPEALVAAVQARLRLAEQERLRPVVNATGIILHTGLGRAVLPPTAVDALAGLNRCCNLQIDLDTGLRGKRNYMTERLLCRLTGAEAAMVVNNNAAATLLLLTVLCREREVIVSRGQLIEIGGSYRLPDCVHQSGARLVEVGTTNKTHLRDYEQAITENTGAILRVNPSNYRVVGFTQEVSTAELASLKRDRDVLVIDDLGCGALMDLRTLGLPHEPTVQESVAAGADLVCFSGDKLIGGPQAGIVVGRRELIQQVKKHPLTRMLRVGKMTDLVLEHTLRLFLNPETLPHTNPTIQMLAVPLEVVKRRAMALKRRLDREVPGVQARVTASESALGGGSLPDTPIPSWAVMIQSPDIPADELNRRLRMNEPPVIARIVQDEVVLDVRTLLTGESDVVFKALMALTQ